MINTTMDILSAADPELAGAVDLELARQRRNIELIASENIVSPAVLAAAGTVLTNKYAEGYPGHRYYGGCQEVDKVEVLAVERAKKLFSCGYANVQPHAGSQANYAVYAALVKPGDTVMGMDLGAGGHLTHGSRVNFSGKGYNMVSYGVDAVTGLIDYDKLEAAVMEVKPKMIIAGASAYPRILDFQRFSAIAKKCGAYLWVDMAHIAGLVAAGLHPSPLPWADVVTTTTHKTLRGPRGGMILSNNPDLYKKLDSSIFPGSQGGPLMHIIAAKAVAFGEAMQPSFAEYQKQILKNAKALAESLLAHGFRLVTGGTDNHLMLCDLRPFSLTGAEMEKRLDEVCITANKNMLPGDPQLPTVTSGLRLGTPAVTTRGFREDDLREVGELIYLTATEFASRREEISARAQALCAAHPIY